MAAKHDTRDAIILGIYCALVAALVALPWIIGTVFSGGH